MKQQQKIDTHTQRLRIKSTKKVQRKLLIFLFHAVTRFTFKSNKTMETVVKKTATTTKAQHQPEMVLLMSILCITVY